MTLRAPVSMTKGFARIDTGVVGDPPGGVIEAVTV